MKFFDKLRPEVYVHRAKLRRDKKTGKRLWGLTCIVTLNPDLVVACDETVNAAYIYALTLENCAGEVLLNSEGRGMTVDFYAKTDDKKPTLHLEALDIGSLRMTRGGEVAELWFQFEAENSAGLHSFVKEYAFTRVFATFTAGQGELALIPRLPSGVEADRRESK